MASPTISGRCAPPAPTPSPPDALTPLLSLPSELRTEIFTHVITLPAPQKLRYKCPHMHWRALKGTRCTHSNASYAALVCPHYKARLPPIWEDNSFWVVILASKQVYYETVGMVAAYNTLSFADVEDLRCFGVLQREIASSLSCKNGTRVAHLHLVRSAEVPSGVVHVNDLRPVIEELVRIKTLENITLRAVHGDVRPMLQVALQRTLLEAGKLPNLRSCRIEVTLDKEGPCRNCHRPGCLYFRFLVGRDMAVAAKINVALAEALDGRSGIKEVGEQMSSEGWATRDIRRFIGPVCVVQRCVLP